MIDAPAEIAKEQLDELSISLIEPKKIKSNGYPDE